MINSRKSLLTLLFLCVCLATYAQDGAEMSKGFGVIVFPMNEQSAETQEFDEFKCYKWAVQRTGFDPLDNTGKEVPTEKMGPDGSVVKGAVGGAVFGALIGAVAGDAGKGAAIGAAAGGLGGAASKASRDAAMAEAIKRQQEQNAAQFLEFKKGFCTCLEAKGYKATY